MDVTVANGGDIQIELITPVNDALRRIATSVIELSDLGGQQEVKMAAANWDGSNPNQEIDANLIGGDPAAQAARLEALG
ncbi:MAG TPA: hypothetical protein VGN19_10805 [Pedococcus sp.]|nr:hypothetical protein [Pedococcus sp.]